VDFRVIAATRSNLARRVQSSTFRQDLFMRLGAYQIQLPALRDRRSDIAELAEYFTTELASPPGTPKVAITAAALAELERRPWWGNVRELRSAIDHALIMARGRAIMPEHLPPPVAEVSVADPNQDVDGEIVAAVRNWAERHVLDPDLAGRLYERLLQVIEPPLFDAAMQKHRRQCATAARTLGIHRTTLRKKLTEHGLDSEVE
jgi:two-component system nitrogen regulation response regulator GlnG